MGVIAACVWHDGRLASCDDLRAVTRAAAHRARRPFQYQVAGPAVLASDRDVDEGAHTESVQPHPARQIALAFDGRLDNRAELAGVLGEPADATERHLVVAAYARWGVALCEVLLGDFSFAIWDRPAQRLVCGRDALGQRPLFYAVTPRSVVVASEPQQVLRHGHVDRGINEGMIAEHLTGRPVTIGETLWKNVRRLPPAHVLVSAAGVVRVRRYWDYDPSAHLRLRRDEDYADAFLELFTEAVRCRLGRQRATGVFLSGGVDSSAVACVASHLARTADAGIEALSVAFPGRGCDETRFVDDVVRRCQIPLDRLPVAEPSREIFEREVDRYLDVPPFPNGVALDPLRRHAAARGLSVVLTGYGGDEWFTGGPIHPRDLLRLGRPLSAVREIRRRSVSHRGGVSAVGLARHSAATVLPRRMRRRLSSRRGRGWPAWIDSSLAASVDLADRLSQPAEPPLRSEAQCDIYRIVTSASQVIADELEDRAGQLAGIDQRHPFYDRRLAEFGLALPDDQRWKAGTTKSVIRRSLASLLPPAIATREDKAEFSSTFVDALESLGGRRAFARLRSEEAGWVNGSIVRERYETMIHLYTRGDESYIAHTDGLWEVIGLEMWLERAVGADQGAGRD